MADQTSELEKKVDANAHGAEHGEDKKEKKPMSLLESVIDEMGDLFNLGVGIAAPVAGTLVTGNPGVAATSAAYLLGTRGTKTSKVIRDESLSGSIFGAFAHYTLAPLRGLGNFAKAAYTAAWPFPANAFYMAEDHLIKKRTFKGLGNNFKENYSGVTKKVYKTVVPLNIAASLLLPSTYMVGAIAVASYLFRRFVAPHKEGEKDDMSYLRAYSNLGDRAFTGTYHGAHSFGSGIRNFFDRLSEMAPAVKPAEHAAPAAH